MTLLTLFELSSIVLVVGEAVVVFFFRDSASLAKASLLALSPPSQCREGRCCGDHMAAAKAGSSPCGSEPRPNLLLSSCSSFMAVIAGRVFYLSNGGGEQHHRQDVIFTLKEGPSLVLTEQLNERRQSPGICRLDAGVAAVSYCTVRQCTSSKSQMSHPHSHSIILTFIFFNTLLTISHFHPSAMKPPDGNAGDGNLVSMAVFLY